MLLHFKRMITRLPHGKVMINTSLGKVMTKVKVSLLPPIQGIEISNVSLCLGYGHIASQYPNK